jgi:signal transduction histidine kinase
MSQAKQTAAPDTNPGASLFLRRFFARLRVRLLLLVLMAVLPALGLAVFSGFEQRTTARREAQDNAQRIARHAAAEQRQIIEGSRQLLVTLAQLKEVRPDRAAEAQALFSSLKGVHPFYANLGAIDARGIPFASAVPLPGEATGKFSVGEFQKGRITGKPSLNMAYPIKREGTGEFLGVVFVALDLGWLTQFASRSDLPEGSTLTVIDRKGTILVRYQAPDVGKNYTGQSVTNHPIVMKQVQQGGEVQGSYTGLDGMKRLYASTPLTRTAGVPDAHVFVGIPVQTAYAAANRSMFLSFVFLGIVSALALGAAWSGGDLFVLRQINGIITAARQLREGNLSARSGLDYGPGELGQLARSFDEMAATIEKQVQDMRVTQAELKALNEELEARVLERTLDLKRSNEDLEQFAYVASHDLQEPLRMVSSYIQLLRQRHGDKLDPNAQQYLTYALDGATRMQQLIVDLLAYSRIGRQGKDFTDVDLDQVLDRALANLRVVIEETGAEILRAPLPKIHGDLTLLTQVFQNLVGNALKFRGEARPTIEITVSPQGREWQFAISDNGIGIAPQDFERVFVVFQRLHSRDTYPGTGIGLSVVKKIVERHGGRIWVESRLGKGTTFYFTLPKPGGR